jgi:hypothetical protein
MMDLTVETVGAAAEELLAATDGGPKARMAEAPIVETPMTETPDA